LLPDLDEIEAQSQAGKELAATNKNHTYRLMRVVKLCIWPPLAMLGNTLLEEVEKGAKGAQRKGKDHLIIRKGIEKTVDPTVVSPLQSTGR
jgi:hypothetical protein